MVCFKVVMKKGKKLRRESGGEPWIIYFRASMAGSGLT